MRKLPYYLRQEILSYVVICDCLKKKKDCLLIQLFKKEICIRHPLLKNDVVSEIVHNVNNKSDFFIHHTPIEEAIKTVELLVNKYNANLKIGHKCCNDSGFLLLVV